MLTAATVDHVAMESMGEDYPALIGHVMTYGDDVPSRIGGTKEILDLRLVLLDPVRSLVDRAGMKREFALEESSQILAGLHDDARLRAISPVAADLITDSTAYGPRIYPQMYRVEQELATAANSRRAVVYVGRHDDLELSDDPGRAFEMPCTKDWQFHLRGSTLDMTVDMRSWDLVWGLSYDVPAFTAAHRAMAKALGVEVGTYTHNAGSAHVYERHFGMELRQRSDDAFDAIEERLGETVDATRRLCAEAVSA